MATTPLRAAMILSLAAVVASAGDARPALAGDASAAGDASGTSRTELAAGDAAVQPVNHATLAEYVASDRFREASGRCATARMLETIPGGASTGAIASGGSGTDCSTSSTTIRPEYEPGEGTFELTLVFHVISNTEGEGDLADEVIEAQVAALNRDYLASHDIGADGTNAQVRFKLADTDPDGNPTSGITRTTNDAWYDDTGTYYNSLAWDPDRYVNIYTMCPGCSGGSPPLGYTFLPQSLGGSVGTPFDRIVMLYAAVGDPGGFPPYDRGRTLTHEMGHYLGLYHTFEGGCDTGGCYGDGDRICDTEDEASERFGCPTSPTSCGTDDPYTNYMDYTDDLCMTEFTPEQVNRMRCTIEHYRPDIYDVVVPTRSTTWSELKTVFGR